MIFLAAKIFEGGGVIAKGEMMIFLAAKFFARWVCGCQGRNDDFFSR